MIVLPFPNLYIQNTHFCPSPCEFQFSINDDDYMYYFHFGVRLEGSRKSAEPYMVLLLLCSSVLTFSSFVNMY